MVQQKSESSHGSFFILRKETVQLKGEISVQLLQWMFSYAIYCLDEGMTSCITFSNQEKTTMSQIRNDTV